MVVEKGSHSVARTAVQLDSEKVVRKASSRERSLAALMVRALAGVRANGTAAWSVESTVDERAVVTVAW